MTTEPDVAAALGWWPAQRNVWTPIGWKDHLFRFNVVYNGTVIAEPCPALMRRPHADRFEGEDFQLTPALYDGGDLPALPVEPTPLYKLDGGFGRQGWCVGATPVLWTEWPVQDGLVVRQETFAHLPAGRVTTGIEPIYAWIRLSVSHVDEVRAPERFTVGVRLSKVFVKDWVPYRLDDGVTLRAEPAAAPIPGGLHAHQEDGALLIDESTPDSRRLAAVAGPDVALRLDDVGDGTYDLRVDLPVRVGASADLLLAMRVQPPAEFGAELALGFDGARARGEEFWREQPATAATIRTPEPYVDEMIRRSLQFAEVVAETNPDNGEVSFLTGSYGYDCLWATPTSMVSHMFLDLAGHHDVVDRHIELFRANQGTVAPPGKAYRLHPGYFSTPKTLTSFDWFCDHGAILHTVAFHALITADQSFVDRWLDPIVKGCEFIRDACAITGHDGVPGLLPPAVATDELLEVSSVWNMGWSYLGLTTAVRLLRRLGDPRAAEFAAFAEQFRDTFGRAFREQSARQPQWTDPAGRQFPLPVANLVEPAERHPFGDLVLLDAGPMFLVYVGLMDAADPLMRSAVEFFRVGPNRRLYGLRPNPIDRPILVHEQSTGEPCYSWNVFHTWALGDRSRFLEGMYGLLTGGISDQTYIASEHRHGMYGNLCTTGLIFWMLRHAVLDDAIADGEVHLLRLVPQAWLPGSAFTAMPTLFGPVDLRFEQAGGTLLVTFTPHWRQPPERVVLHVPPGVDRVEVNGDVHVTGPGAHIDIDLGVSDGR